MEVVIGTYEEHLVGFVLQKTKKDDKPSYELKRSFTNKAHEGSIRSVAHSWKYLVSGGVDEVIHIISMKHRIDAGTLVGAHTGTITALAFLRSAYLFSGSEDGTIGVWNSRKGWALEKVLRGHKEGVSSLSVHASGKLLLSVSARDRTLRTWNLVKGRCAYVINLKAAAQQVTWSTTGAYFAVLFEHRIDVYDLGTGGVAHCIERGVDPLFEKRLHKVLFANDNTLFICGDSPDVVVYDLQAGFAVSRTTLANNRIKDMVLVEAQSLHPDLKDKSMLPNELWLVTASSDGLVRITTFDGDDLTAKPQSVAEVNSTCRPTCLTVWTSSQDSKFDSFVVPKLKLPQEQIEEIKGRLRKLRQMLGKELGKTDEEIKRAPSLGIQAAIMAKKVAAAKRQFPKEGEASSSSAFPAASSSAPARKKAKVSEEESEEEEEENAEDDDDDQEEDEKNNGEDVVDEEEDDDDEEAIRQMKADSKVLKEMNKYRKGKKKNITTFRQRKQQQQQQQTAEAAKKQRVKKFTTKVPVSSMNNGHHNSDNKRRNFHSKTSASPSPSKFRQQQNHNNNSNSREGNRQQQQQQTAEAAKKQRVKKFTTKVPVSSMNNGHNNNNNNRGGNRQQQQQQNNHQKRPKSGAKKFTTRVPVSGMKRGGGGGGGGGFKPRNRN